MKRVACETAGGYIFVCLADQPMDFAPFRTFMEPYFLPHRLRDAKVAYESTIIEKGNWKLVWKTTANATTAPATIRNSARPIRKPLRPPAFPGQMMTIRKPWSTGRSARTSACRAAS